jgi:hypothetical protein
MLTDALARTLTTISLNLDEVTGYLGHRDSPGTDGETTSGDAARLVELERENQP